MQDFLASHWLDFLTTVLGLIYIWLEYRASIALWIVGVIMPALDIILYWSHGLYGDAGLAAYYTLAAFYGYMVWKFGKKRGQTDKQQLPITHFPLRLVVPVLAFFLAAWGLTYYVLITWTNSTVPVLDSFNNALSIVGLWTLARKYLEQWLFWMVVDLISCVLYVQKGIPFKALLYGLYVVIAVMGWFRWKKMMNNEQNIEQTTAAL
jgi:nicotinamide mononucleotide transporter